MDRRLTKIMEWLGGVDETVWRASGAARSGRRCRASRGRSAWL